MNILLDIGYLDHLKEEDRRLIIAAHSNDIDAVDALLEEGVADIEAADNIGWTSLMWASDKGNRDIVYALLKNGANVNAATKGGSPALNFACQNGHTEIVNALLDRCASPKDHMPFLWACCFGHSDIVAILLNRGVVTDIDGIDEYGRTGMKQAAKYKNTEVMYVLMAAGAHRLVNGDGSTQEEREMCLVAQARPHKEILTAIPEIREYFCDDLALIIFKNAYPAHTRIQLSDFPLAPTETIAGREKYVLKHGIASTEDILLDLVS